MVVRPQGVVSGFHSLVAQTGLSLDPFEVPPALLRRHHPADLQEMIQHLGFALGASFGPFRQDALDFGRDGGSLGQKLFEFPNACPCTRTMWMNKHQ